MPTLLLTIFGFVKIDLKDPSVITKRKPIKTKPNPFNYINTFLDSIIRLAFLVLLVTLIYTLVLYYCKILWTTYISTPIGLQYTQLFSERARNISEFLGHDLLALSIRLVGLSVVICFSVAVIFQLLHISRLFYISRGIMGRLFFFGLPLTTVAAIFTQKVIQINPLPYAYSASVMPTLMVFSGCFKYARTIIPEIGSMFQKIGFQKEVIPGSIIYLKPISGSDGGKRLEFDVTRGTITGKKTDNHDDIIVNGIFSNKYHHDFILYRYAGDFIFQYDDKEIVLNDRMASSWSKIGRWKRRLELKKDGTTVLSIEYRRILPLETDDIFYEMHCLVNTDELFYDEYLSFEKNPSESAEDQAFFEERKCA